MCYSAQVWSDYRRYVRDFRAKVGIKEFFDLFFRRASGEKLLLSRGMEMAFADPQTDEERAIWDLIVKYRTAEATRIEQELFEQRTRLSKAERKLAVKETKLALNEQRVATNKVEAALGKLANLWRTEERESDSRIFPDWYAPVLVMEDGQMVVKPMRYRCRPARAPAFYDVKYPGTFNARRDNLEGFWRGEFGQTHAVVLGQSFFENVPLHKAEGRELRDGEEVQNTVIQFRPQPTQDMLFACVFSHWQREGEDDLLSFALITDEPPPEVAAAGHDRCVIPIKRENLATWLSPDRGDLAAQYAVLDDRERPFYQHFLMAA